MKARICIFAAMLLAQGCTKRGASAELGASEPSAEPVPAEPSEVDAEIPPESSEVQTRTVASGMLEGDEILEQQLVGGLGQLEGDRPRAMRVESFAEMRERESALPSVQIEQLEVEGLEPEPAERSLRARLATVARCAALAMERGEAIELRPSLTLQIDQKGKVEKLVVEGVPEAQLHRCVEQAAARWRFRTGAAGELRTRLVLGVPASP